MIASELVSSNAAAAALAHTHRSLDRSFDLVALVGCSSVVVAPSSGLSTYRKKLAVRKKSWGQYLKKIDDDPSRVERNAVVKELIRREGIPPEHRGKVR